MCWADCNKSTRGLEHSITYLRLGLKLACRRRSRNIANGGGGEDRLPPEPQLPLRGWPPYKKKSSIGSNLWPSVNSRRSIRPQHFVHKTCRLSNVRACFFGWARRRRFNATLYVNIIVYRYFIVQDTRNTNVFLMNSFTLTQIQY